MTTVTSLRLLAAGLAAVAGLAAAQPAAPDDAAEVLVSEGDTTLVRGRSLSTPVRPDVPIRSGDRIRTGEDGRVQLRFADGALISIQPRSEFHVEDWAYGGGRERSLLGLTRGALRAVSGRIGKRSPDDWRLTTPTATIGIRGTAFSVAETVCPSAGCPTGTDPGLVVAVTEGRVVVANAAGSVEVPAGATLRVRDATTRPALAVAAPRGAAGVRRSAPAPVNAPMGPPASAVPPEGGAPSIGR